MKSSGGIAEAFFFGNTDEGSKQLCGQFHQKIRYLYRKITFDTEYQWAIEGTTVGISREAEA
jgi:hypothetical protein